MGLSWASHSTLIYTSELILCSTNTSAIADHVEVKATGHKIKWDHVDILAKGKTDYHCKIKETLFIQELEPAFNVNVGSEKLMLN